MHLYHTLNIYTLASCICILLIVHTVNINHNINPADTLPASVHGNDVVECVYRQVIKIVFRKKLVQGSAVSV